MIGLAIAGAALWLIIVVVLVLFVPSHEHEWTAWRDGKVTRRRDGAAAGAEGRECMSCGKLEVRPR